MFYQPHILPHILPETRAALADMRAGLIYGVGGVSASIEQGGMSEERLALELSVQNRQIVHGDHVGGILGFSVKCSLPFNHLFHRCK